MEEAAIRLAAIIAEERADVLTTYDEHGVTGHPDHVQVYRALRAVAIAMVAGDVARLGSPRSAFGS